MNRKELLAFAKNLIADYKRNISDAEERGIFSPGSYMWQEYLADYTGVELKAEADLEQLANAELQKIRDAYI